LLTLLKRDVCKIAFFLSSRKPKGLSGIQWITGKHMPGGDVNRSRLFGRDDKKAVLHISL